MTTVNLSAASWTLAKADLHLKVAASALLDSQPRSFEDLSDLLAKDVWIQKSHNFHLSFHISFDSMSAACGTSAEAMHTDFIALALTQAPCWSQLLLIPSLSPPAVRLDGGGMNSRFVDLKIEQDSASDLDLSNVNPPDGISRVSFVSVQISLIFSQTSPRLQKPRHSAESASSTFEDLFFLDDNRPIPYLKISERLVVQDEITDGYKAMLHQLPGEADEMLCDFENQLKGAGTSMWPDSRSLCSLDVDFCSLQSWNSVLSSQTSQPLSRPGQGMTSSGPQFHLETTRIADDGASGSVAIFKSFPSARPDFFRSTGKGSASLSSPAVRHMQLPPAHNVAFYHALLSLTDAGLRSLVHPRPTRLRAGIKLTETDAGPYAESSYEKRQQSSLSNLAPSIFTPGYTQAVVERAPLVSSIAKSLAVFLRCAQGSETDDLSHAEESQQQEDVKEMLRGHLWMTMTNALRISHSENARRLKPLAMPCPQSKERRGEEAIMPMQDGTELLDDGFSSCLSSPRYSVERMQEEILGGMESELVCDLPDESEEELLLNDMQLDVSLLGDELEDLYVPGRAGCLDELGADEGITGVEGGGDGGFADDVEDMLF